MDVVWKCMCVCMYGVYVWMECMCGCSVEVHVCMCGWSVCVDGGLCVDMFTHHDIGSREISFSISHSSLQQKQHFDHLLPLVQKPVD